MPCPMRLSEFPCAARIYPQPFAVGLTNIGGSGAWQLQLAIRHGRHNKGGVAFRHAASRCKARQTVARLRPIVWHGARPCRGHDNDALREGSETALIRFGLPFFVLKKSNCPLQITLQVQIPLAGASRYRSLCVSVANSARNHEGRKGHRNIGPRAMKSAWQGSHA